MRILAISTELNGAPLFSRSEELTAPMEGAVEIVLGQNREGVPFSADDLRQSLDACADVNQLRALATWILDAHVHLVRVAFGARRSWAWQLQEALDQAQQRSQPQLVMEPGAISLTIPAPAVTRARRRSIHVQRSDGTRSEATIEEGHITVKRPDGTTSDITIEDAG